MSSIHIFTIPYTHHKTRLDTAIHSSTGLYMAKCSYAEPCTAILGYTHLDKAKHSYIRLYTAIQSCTQLYTAIQSYIQLYKAIHSYTELYTAIHS